MAKKNVSEKGALEDLASAIITKALDDYKNAYTKHLAKPQDAEVKIRLDELRVFFRGQWFAALTTLDADFLVERIERECKEKHRLKEALMNRRKETEWK